MTLTSVVCGIPEQLDDASLGEPCPESLHRTHSPAGSLWCPVHGHVVAMLATPPLTGTVFLNYGSGRCEEARLEELTGDVLVEP